MQESLNRLTREFLTWLSERPRTYAETMEAWQTNCPRHSTWEDACSSGLVRIEGGETTGEARVALSELGETLLNRSRHVDGAIPRVL